MTIIKKTDVNERVGEDVERLDLYVRTIAATLKKKLEIIQIVRVIQ